MYGHLIPIYDFETIPTSDIVGHINCGAPVDGVGDPVEK